MKKINLFLIIFIFSNIINAQTELSNEIFINGKKLIFPSAINKGNILGAKSYDLTNQIFPIIINANNGLNFSSAGKSGVAYATSVITAAAGFLQTLFATTEVDSANKYIVKVDTSAGDVALSTLAAPSTLTFLKDGDSVVFIKSTSDVNKVIVDDATPGANFNGFTGVIFNYINQPGESITLLVDASNDKWGVEI